MLATCGTHLEDVALDWSFFSVSDWHLHPGGGTSMVGLVELRNRNADQIPSYPSAIRGPCRTLSPDTDSLRGWKARHLEPGTVL